MQKQTLIALVLVGASCGGSSQPMTPVAPVPMTTPATPSEPANPVDPVKPAELARPTMPPANVKAELLATEIAAYENAKPVFEKYCAKCHSKAGSKQSVAKREHFDMTTYPFGGHHAMDVHDEIRVVLGVTGKKPTMPADKKGAVKGEELDLITAWADAFDASHKGGAHEGHDQHSGGHKH